MSMEATFRVRCDVKLAGDCREVQTVERVQGRNERMPDGLVPPGWTQLKNKDLACPECTRAMNV